MATPSKVHVDVNAHPAYYLPGVSEEAAKKTSELLQRNHEDHHIFFNKEGFHNHIVHHILTIYALGANPKDLQRHYNSNASYQRPPMSSDPKEVEAMSDPSKFKQFLGDEKYYSDYLAFFQREMETKGWQAVVNEYLFARDARADDLLVRTFAGFLHPLIHLGFGIEFQQPAIIAEALAQAAVHDSWVGKLYLPAEKMARENPPKDGGKTLVSLLREIHDDQELSTAPHWSDGNKIRDGLLVRAPDAMLKYASQYVVRPEDDLARKTAEMINAAVLYTGGAQRPDKEIKFDFYYIHCVNCSIFHSAFLSQDWLADKDKRRLLEWKARTDLAMYASRRASDILVDEINEYKPKQPGSDVFRRVLDVDDDGHASKLVRALANGKKVCEKYEGAEEEGFEVKGDMWEKLLHMAIDSVEGPEPRWIRSAGFEQAWENVKARSVAVL